MGFAVLCWTYQALCITSRRDTLEISDCILLMFSWIYQRFPSLCPPSRDLFVFPLVSRLVLSDHHSPRMLDLINELDRVGFNDFTWTPYILSTWRDIEPDWVTEEGEIETLRASIPIVLFMFVRYHHVDRVKRQ
ncbi:hypothetical protein PIB30_091873 [Stylosanthes scabra]|uniref:Aminotransferase-like plant mobile domain-containing protein n=1 Tax=Stylosanthes scabra TaxID=79078 RepID=A0ABU6QVQ1_9FABA|nr:hypothetical protein [Stylosanthes scabra]